MMNCFGERLRVPIGHSSVSGLNRSGGKKPLKVHCRECEHPCERDGLDSFTAGFGYICDRCETVNILVPSGNANASSKMNDEGPPSKTDEEKPLSAGQRRCAKCSLVQDASNEHCPRCGLYFAYLISGRAQIGGGSAEHRQQREGLLRRWTSVSQDFTNEDAHTAFIKLCAENDALHFAGQCYRKALDRTPDSKRLMAYRDKVIKLAMTHIQPAKRTEVSEERSNLRTLIILLIGALIMLGFAVGFYVVTQYQTSWQHNG